MLPVTAVIAAGILIAYMEGRSLWKDKQVKALIVFASILSTGMLLYCCMLLELPVPNPTETISKWLEPIYKPLITWVEGGES